MLFKCPLCFKRYWTKGGRDQCQQKHHRVGRLSYQGPGFGVLPEKAPIPYQPVNVEEQPKPSALDVLGNFATGYVTADLLNDLTDKLSSEGPEAKPEARPEARPEAEPPREEPKAAPAPADDYSSLSSSSSLDSYSSLDSSSSSDSWSSSNDW